MKRRVVPHVPQLPSGPLADPAVGAPLGRASADPLTTVAAEGGDSLHCLSRSGAGARHRPGDRRRSSTVQRRHRRSRSRIGLRELDGSAELPHGSRRSARLPYLVLKVLWTFDLPVGVTDRSVFDRNEWVAGNALMAVLQLAGLLLVLALTRPWARRVPTWLLLFPVWVGTGLLFQVVVGAALLWARSSASSSGGSTDLGEFQPWVFAVIYPSFAGQGSRWPSPSPVTSGHDGASCWASAPGRSSRGEQRECGHGRSTTWRGWPRPLPGWLRRWPSSAGTGRSSAQFGDSAALGSDSPWGLQASRMVGAVTAVVGLLGLAGRWGQRTRFWLPTALTWVGAGAMAAFDGLALVAFLLLGTDASDPAWGLTDTVLVIKAVIGVSAGAVAAFAVAAAVKDNQKPAGNSPPAPLRLS